MKTKLSNHYFFVLILTWVNKLQINIQMIDYWYLLRDFIISYHIG